jgi:hypothetical protein
MAETFDLIYNCGPVSRQFHADKESRVKLLIGPFGTGKTSSAAYDIIECQSKRVIEIDGKKRSRFAVVRNTYPELRDTTIKTYLDWFPDTVFGSYNQTDKIYRIAYDGREIEIIFKALDTPKDVRDLLSLELTGAHVDEAREIHHDVIKGLLGRIGRYPSMKDTSGVNPFITPPQVTLTTNYPSREHYLYKEFVEAPITGYSIYEQTQEENKHNLRPGYYEDLESDYAERPDLLKTLVRGEWGVTVRGRQVYPEFNRRFHVATRPLLSVVKEGVKGGRAIIRGWDNTGLNPACIITYINSLGQWFWVREFCGEDARIIDFAQAVHLWCAQEFPADTEYIDIGDPAGKIRDTLKGSPRDYIREETGIDIQDGLQSFKIRRESVAGRLSRQINGMPALVVDPGCTRTIDGFEGGYAYPEIGNSGMFKTEPEKNQYSHIHDAGQYPATILFPPGPAREDDYEEDDHVTNTRNSVTGY